MFFSGQMWQLFLQDCVPSSYTPPPHVITSGEERPCLADDALFARCACASGLLHGARDFDPRKSDPLFETFLPSRVRLFNDAIAGGEPPSFSLHATHLRSLFVCVCPF